MASRVFTDRAGVHWTVWDVLPGQHNLQSRQAATLPEEMSGGWLCFESVLGKRRLYPVPSRWEELPDVKLDLLCRAGIPVGRPALAPLVQAPAVQGAIIQVPANQSEPPVLAQPALVIG